MQSLPVAGIDLGTCFTCVYVYHNGSCVHVPFDGDRTIPSIISYADNRFYYGKYAKDNHRFNPLNTFYDVKRVIGLKWDQCLHIYNQSNYTFTMSANATNDPIYYICTGENQGFPVTPYQLDALFLQYLVQEASKTIGQTIEHVVITVPAFFTPIQTQATLDAARMAGLNVMQIMHEPSAAALASNPNAATNVAHYLVYDLGGGTFDVAILSVNGLQHSVIVNDGDLHLGGQDFDNLLYNYLIEEFENMGEDTINWSVQKKARLRREVEDIKISLSSGFEVTLKGEDFGLEEDDNIVITRKQFEKLIEPYIQKTIAICERALQQRPDLFPIINGEINLGPNDKILLVGGSSYIPMVSERLDKRFVDKVWNGVDPNTIVARGACLTAVKRYCELKQIQNGPVNNSVVHNIVVRSVFIKPNKGDPEEILPRGTACNKWVEKELVLSGLFRKEASVLLYTTGESQKTEELGSFKVVQNAWKRDKVVIKIMMDDSGKLHYWCGTEKEELNSGEVDLQNQMSSTELEAAQLRYKLIREYTDFFRKKKEEAEKRGPKFQEVYLHITKVLTFIQSIEALRMDLIELEKFCQNYKEWINRYLPK